MQRLLDTLPLALLPSACGQQEWLQGIGCRLLGQLRRLPRPGLQRRGGKPLLAALDQAYGNLPELFEWYLAPPGFEVQIELPDHVERAADLLLAAQHLLTQLCGWLAAGQLAVTRIALTLQHERGRVAIAPTQLDILLAEASWQEPHLLRLLKERLEQLALAAPAIGIGLAATGIEARAAPSLSLFPEAGGSPRAHRQLIELLTARLGAAHILQAAPLADHRPEAANQWLPVLAAASASNPSAASTPEGPPHSAAIAPRPVWLLPQAIRLETRDHRPFYGCVLVPVSPPERIEAGWWSAEPVTRDYFIAEGRDCAYYWIYRERADREADPHWYLHGLFG